MEKLLSSCFEVVVNLNDTFAYACGDAETINADDAKDLIPFINIYGGIATVAYCALKREIESGFLPKPIFEDKNYETVLAEIRAILNNQESEIFFELRWEKNRIEKEIKKYGSRLKWKNIDLPKYNRTDGSFHPYVAYTADGNFGVGINMYEAEKSLERNIEAKRKENEIKLL